MAFVVTQEVRYCRSSLLYKRCKQAKKAELIRRMGLDLAVHIDCIIFLKLYYRSLRALRNEF